MNKRTFYGEFKRVSLLMGKIFTDKRIPDTVRSRLSFLLSIPNDIVPNHHIKKKRIYEFDIVLFSHECKMYQTVPLHNLTLLICK